MFVDIWNSWRLKILHCNKNNVLTAMSLNIPIMSSLYINWSQSGFFVARVHQVFKISCYPHNFIDVHKSSK